MSYAQTEPPSSSHWWKLPLEIRDMIYHLAFGKSEVVKISDRQFSAYRAQHAAKKVRLRIKQTAPTTLVARPQAFVEPMLVSQQWFEEVSELIGSRTHFLVSCVGSVDFFLPDDGPQPYAITRHMQTLSIGLFHPTDHRFSELAAGCPNLQSIHLTIDAGMFEPMIARNQTFPMDIVADKLAPDAIRRSGLLEPWLNLRGLRTVQVSFELDLGLQWSVEDKAMLRHNAQVLEGVLKETAMLPKEVSGLDNDMNSSQSSALFRPPWSPLGIEDSPRSIGLLEDSDIPINRDELMRLMVTNRSNLADWVLSVKTRLAEHEAAKGHLKAHSND